MERTGCGKAELDVCESVKGDDMEKRKHITATEGMVLTNGETYATELWLGDGDSFDNWREITVEEAERMQEKENIYE